MKLFPKHKTMRDELINFTLLLSVLSIYFIYLSWKYDVRTGFMVSALTWSFFVLCTPIADAGFLIDFPIRLITGLRMLITEILVWAIAIIINIVALQTAQHTYDKTFLTSLLYKILTNPWPYWSVIVVCGIGTFLSIHFADEMIDAVSDDSETNPHNKQSFSHKLIMMLALIVIIMWAYYSLLEMLGIQLPGQ